MGCVQHTAAVVVIIIGLIAAARGPAHGLVVTTTNNAIIPTYHCRQLRPTLQVRSRQQHSRQCRSVSVVHMAGGSSSTSSSREDEIRRKVSADICTSSHYLLFHYHHHFLYQLHSHNLLCSHTRLLSSRRTAN